MSLERSPGDNGGDSRPTRENALLRQHDKPIQQLGDIETLNSHPVPLLEIDGEGIKLSSRTGIPPK